MPGFQSIAAACPAYDCVDIKKSDPELKLLHNVQILQAIVELPEHRETAFSTMAK